MNVSAAEVIKELDETAEWMEQHPFELMNCPELLRLARSLIEEGQSRRGWEPIDTAPKDGTAILIYDPKGSNPHADDAKDNLHVYVCRWENGCWLEGAGEEWFQWSPTHWTPIFQPPTDIGTK